MIDAQTQEVMIRICRGNPGAINVMMGMIKSDSVRGAVAIHHLDDLGLRGPEIWVLFKEYCKGDIKRTIDECFDRDTAMVKAVRMIAGHRNEAPANGE